MEKKARIDMRVETQQKKDFKRRAKAVGLTLTEWILNKLLREHEE